MPYASYSTKDFVLDEHFINWVINPTPAGNSFWESWLEQHPEKLATVEEARQIILLAHFKQDSPSEEDYREVWHRIESAIDAFDQQASQSHKVLPLYAEPPIRKNWLTSLPARSRLVAAAIVLVLIFSGVGYWLIKMPQPMEERMNPRGQQSFLLLPDGTKVWLNAASTLQYPRDFDGKPIREVFLQGEAFFEVVKNRNKPFVVKTTGIAIKVLGTRFNVKSYGEEELIETTLVEGKVEVDNYRSQENITLQPNQKAIFSRKTRDITLATVDTGLYTDWVTGKLVFKNAPVSEVLNALSRKFDVNIQTGNENLHHCTVTADFTNQSLVKTLELMCKLVEATYHRQGKEILLQGAGCKK